MNDTEHGCRPEPHCECGHNAWYHEDDEPAACWFGGCTCQDYRLCLFAISPDPGEAYCQAAL